MTRPTPRCPISRCRSTEAGFLLPFAASASLVLVLSSLSLQAAALQARSQVLAGQRLRQAEDQLMSAAQHWLAGAEQRLARGAELAQLGDGGQVGDVAYRLVAWDGAGTGQPTATLELLPSAESPRPLRAAFALELAGAEGVLQLRGLRELGLRGRAAQGVAP